MGFSNNLLTYPFTKIAANGQGDLQQALGTGSMSQAAMMTGQAGYINPMAKYKGFRNTTAVFSDANARNNARAAARYGMAEPQYFYPISYTIPPSWIYNKPDGSMYPLRAMDFVKDTISTTAGYDKEAVPPLAIEIPGGLPLQATFGILLWRDAMVNNYISRIGGAGSWVADRSLSVQELIGSGQNNYYDYYISFAIYLYNSAGTAIEDSALVATNKKFGNIEGVNTFLFYPQGDGTQYGDYIDSQGIHYPQIPILNNPYNVGRKYLIALCIGSTGPSSPLTYAYQVIPNNYSVLSLGFDPNRRWDFIEAIAEASSVIDLLSGSFNSGPVLTFIRQHTGGWNEYSCSAWVTVNVTADPSYTGSGTTVHVSAMAPGGTFGNIPGQSGAYGEYTADVGVTVSGGQTVTATLVQLPNVFIYKDAAHSVVVNAEFTQGGRTKSFNNTLTITD